MAQYIKILKPGHKQPSKNQEVTSGGAVLMIRRKNSHTCYVLACCAFNINLCWFRT